MDREELAQKILFRTENANSYEFGKAGNRHKVYYTDCEDLKAQVALLKLAGLIDDE